MNYVSSYLNNFSQLERSNNGISLNCERIVKHLLKCGYGSGVNLPCLLRFYVSSLGLKYEDILKDKVLYDRLYKRLLRYVRLLEKEGYVKVSKINGFLWIEPLPKMVDLISSFDIVKFKDFSKREHGHRFMREDRFDAFMVLRSKKTLERDDWSELLACLDSYVEKTSNLALVFKHREEDRYLLLHYNHRFLRRNIKRKLKEYDKIWSLASQKFDKGVFLTLTLDPASYKNLVDASKRISLAFNRFMSFLSCRLGFRPFYISSLEPQDSGNPHLQIVIFGISRIEDHFRLTKILQKHGFGMIHWEYQIKKNKDGNWVWANRRYKPKNCRTFNVKDYLKKYLVKTFSSYFDDSDKSFSGSFDVSKFKIAFYFASNKRFFTCSHSLLVFKKKFVGSGLWVFVGVYDWLELPNFVYEFFERDGVYIGYNGNTWILERVYVTL
jgi:hypothetical protein